MTKFQTSAAVDFHVVNSAGTLLLATRCRDLAKSRARQLAERHDGVEVREVTTTVTSRRVYRPAAPKLEGAALARAFA